MLKMQPETHGARLARDVLASVDPVNQRVYVAFQRARRSFPFCTQLLDASISANLCNFDEWSPER